MAHFRSVRPAHFVGIRKRIKVKKGFFEELEAEKEDVHSRYSYDLSALTPTRFEFSSKDARVNMRLPADLLDAVKATAARKGTPYQRFIRQALEQALHG